MFKNKKKESRTTWFCSFGTYIITFPGVSVVGFEQETNCRVYFWAKLWIKKVKTFVMYFYVKVYWQIHLKYTTFYIKIDLPNSLSRLRKPR